MLEENRQIYFTFQRVGGQVKVTALDALSKKEVCVIVPVGLRREDSKQLAYKKLLFTLKKEQKF